MIDKGAAPAVGSLTWWLAASPLRLFTAGDEAVFVFFALSGFVLVNQVLSVRGFSWVGYYVSRVARLMVPVIASVLFSAALVLLVPRPVNPDGVTWLSPPYNPDGVSWADLFRDVEVLFSPLKLNGPLWSLRWEMLFSLALPLIVVLLAVIAGRAAGGILTDVAVVAVSAVTTVVGLYSGTEALTYMPLFVLGGWIAFRREDWRGWSARRWAGRGLLVVMVLGLSASMLLRPYVDPAGAVAVLARVATMLGATGVVALTVVYAPSSGFLASRPVTHLGTISFSLYLTHQPILAAFGVYFGSEQWPLAVLCGLVASLLIAGCFHRVVERPSHRMSRRLGRHATELAASDWRLPGSPRARAEEGEPGRGRRMRAAE